LYIINYFVDFLREWKELIGAVIGGVFSLLVALLVAHQSRRAEEKTAATLLIGELIRIQEIVADVESKTNITTDQKNHLLAEHLCHFRVRLSPLFDASIARVLNIDVYLAATLTLASSFIRDMEPLIERLSLDVEALHRGEQPKRNEAAITSDVCLISMNYRLINQHAKHSARLLQEIALSRCISWKKLQRHISPSSEDLDLLLLLKRGGID
jgi:hypothetical protein